MRGGGGGKNPLHIEFYFSRKKGKREGKKEGRRRRSKKGKEGGDYIPPRSQ